METTLYLAMTAGEMAAAEHLPPHCAWMACHFSSYSTGLSNCPAELPEDSLIMVNDRIPIWHHDPAHILLQLQHLTQTLCPEGIVLDFQRPSCWETEQLTGILVKELPCPVAVSELYAGSYACPVFLSAPPPHLRLETHLQKWDGREVWLEAALSGETLTVTPEGCREEEFTPEISARYPFQDEKLLCGYDFSVEEEKAVFTLQRREEDLYNLLTKAGELGISKAVGLYQQLKNFPPKDVLERDTVRIRS